MARMIPSQPAEATSSDAERRIFRRLREETPETWTVLHSVGLTTHQRKLWAEIDFVAVGPGGIFCLEVKGGGVARNEGQWIFTDRRGIEYIRHEGPFHQAGSASAALRKRLRQEIPATRQALFGYGVIMPDCDFRTVGPDIEQEVLHDARHHSETMTAFLSRLASHFSSQPNSAVHSQRHLSPHDVSRITSFLRGDFNAPYQITGVIGSVNDEIRNLTQEQTDAIALFSETAHVLCRGGAGTGKTMLAISEASRLARDGQRVLLTCQSYHLANDLAVRLSQEPLVHVAPIHDFIQSVVREAGAMRQLPDASSRDLRDIFFPELAAELLLSDVAKFDAIVVDEGQDVIRGPLLTALEASIGGDFQESILRVFFDPQQDVFEGTSLSGMDALLTLKPAMCILKVNCRNTPQIAQTTSQLSGAPMPRTRVTTGVPVTVHRYAGAIDHKQQLERRLRVLISEGVDPASIILLGPYPFDRSVVSQIALASGSIRPFGAESRPNSMAYATISEFKGLEADVVILVEVEELATTQARQEMYVGCSRARAILDVFVSQSASSEFDELALEFGASIQEDRD